MCIHCGTENNDRFWFISTSIQVMSNRWMVNSIKSIWENPQKDPTDAYLWYTIGDLHEILENYKVAAMCFDKAKSLGYGIDVDHVFHKNVIFNIYSFFPAVNCGWNAA